MALALAIANELVALPVLRPPTMDKHHPYPAKQPTRDRYEQTMSSDPPPTGKFRPKKKKKASSRITPGATTAAGAAAAAAVPAAGAGADGAGGDGGGGRGAGGGGRGGRGRGGRGRSRSPSGGRAGRGGGRGGRFVMPRGRAYFTGDQAKDGAQPAGGAEAPAASAPAAACAASATTASASSSRAVRPCASRSKSPTGPRKTEGRNLGAGLDEGEETVLGEIEGGGVGGAGLAGETSQAKSSLHVLDKKKEPSRSAAGGDGDDLVDTDDDEGERPARSRVSARGSRGTAASTSFIGGEDIYTYDSDSTDDSGDGSTSGRPVWSDHAPARLPLPPPRTYGGHQHFNYDCQRGAAQNDSSISPAGAAAAVPDVVGSSLAEEKKGDEGQGNLVDKDAPAPVFLNLATASAQDRKIEADTWTVFKLPTRLPHIAPKAGVKSEFGGDGMMPMKMDPDEQQQAEQSQRYPGAPAPVGNRFDDSLRTAPAGRYGKIRIHQSGKAVLVIGEGTPEEVTLDLNEGIPCSMLQHAVNIDPTEATYVNMGEVHHSIVATPDIESAFAGR